MLTVGLTEAKRRFVELVGRAKRGERIRITRYGKPKAEIVAPTTNRRDTSASGKPRGRFTQRPQG